MECNFCKNSFANEYTLLTHQKSARYCLKIQNIAEKSKYNCIDCGKSLTTKKSLERHIQSCPMILDKNVKDIIENKNDRFMFS